MAKKITKIVSQETIDQELNKMAIEIKTNSDQDIIDCITWCEQLGNRMSANGYEINKVWAWYHKIFGRSPGDKDCNSCVAASIRTLQAWAKENKAQYIK